MTKENPKISFPGKAAHFNGTVSLAGRTQQTQWAAAEQMVLGVC